MTDTAKPQIEPPMLDRRGFVGKAAVGVGIAWVAPSVISVSAGGAQSLVNSPPPTPPDGGSLGDGGDQGFGEEEAFGDDNLMAEEDLPRTGFDLQDPLAAAFGLIAAGGAAKIWSTTARRRAERGTEAIAEIGPDDATDL